VNGAVLIGVDRDFAYRVPLHLIVLALGAGAAWLVLGALWLASDIITLTHGPRSHWDGTWWVHAVPLWLVGGGLASLCWGVRLWFTRQRSWVLVTRINIAARNWRGGEGRLLWDEVEELRTGPRVRDAPLELRGRGQTLRLDPGVEDAEDLRDTIVAAAGLSERGSTWSGTVYRRPAQP
jgi:hypothetical protein